MKKLLIVVAVLVVAGVVWGKFNSQTKTKTQTSSQKQEEFSGTLAQAMKLGVPMKCAWQTNDGSGESFVKGEDMYLKTTMQGRTGHMVKKGDCIWSWDDTQKQGVKFCQQPGETEEADETWTPEAANFKAEGVDWSVEYQCRPDIFGADKFDLPSDVTFTDLAEMMKGFAPGVQQ